MNFDGIRICAVEDSMGVGERLAWPSKVITWNITGSLPGFDDLEIKGSYGAGWDDICSVCGLVATYNPNYKTANVLMGTGLIDGPGKVLGWSELPQPGVTQLKQLFDTGDLFVISKNPPTDKIDFGRVSKHECCHAAGVPHISPPNLMAAYYSASNYKLQSGDVAELVARYDLHRDSPTPPLPPTIPPPATGEKELSYVGQRSDGTIVQRIGGVEWTYKPS